MVNMFDEIWVEAEAKGKAEGLIALIRHRVVKGKLTIDEARVEVRELVADGKFLPRSARRHSPCSAEGSRTEPGFRWLAAY